MRNATIFYYEKVLLLRKKLQANPQANLVNFHISYHIIFISLSISNMMQSYHSSYLINIINLISSYQSYHIILSFNLELGAMIETISMIIFRNVKAVKNENKSLDLTVN